jgi:3-oxoacyl-[acyl-carrier protein] reductase
MDLKLTNRVALVTGGSSGLGFAIARELACEGASVAIVARRKTELEHAASEILKVARTRVLPLVGDVSKEGEADRHGRATEESLGPIDILLANAGGPPSTLFDSTTDEQYVAAIQLNLLSSIRLARASGPPQARRKVGRLVFQNANAPKKPVPRPKVC